MSEVIEVIELSPETIDQLADAIARKIRIPAYYPGYIHHHFWDYRPPYQPYYPVYCGTSSVVSNIKTTSYN